MDRFLDEQEALDNPSPAKDRVLSPPPVHSMMYGTGSHKHHTHSNVRFGEINDLVPSTSIANMGDVQLNPELNTAIPTTLAGSVNSSVPTGNHVYMDTLVQTCIANILPNMPPEVIDSMPDLEPPNKKIKTTDNNLTSTYNNTEVLTPALDSDALAKLEQISNNPMGNVELSISSVTPVSSQVIREENINSLSRETNTPTNKEVVETMAQ